MGDIILAITTMHDITEQKTAEEAIRSSERKFSTIFNSTPTLIVITEVVTGRIVDVNEAARRTFGYPGDEAVGRIFHELDLWEDPSDADVILRVLKEKGEVRDFEVRFRKRDGGVVIGLYSADVIRLDGIDCILTLHDLTKQRRAEAPLRESEERFRIAQELSPDGFTIFHPVRDAQGRIFDFIWVYENAAIASMNGTDPATVVGRRLLEVFPDHASSPFHKRYQNVAETGKSGVLEASF